MSEQAYLSFHFPMKKEEFKVDYNQVASHSYRINYWSKIKSRGGAETNIISRSHYVQLNQDEDGQWTYKILDD